MLILLEGGYEKCRRLSIKTDAVSIVGATALRLRVSVPEKWPHRRREKDINRLREYVMTLPVHRMLYHPDFPLKSELSSMPIKEQTADYIIKLTAGEILAHRGGEEVLIVSDRADKTVLAAFFALCRGFRYVRFAGGSDAVLGTFNRAGEPMGVTVTRLRRLYFPGDAALVLCKPGGDITLHPNCAVLRFSPGTIGGRELTRAKFTFPDRVKASLPTGYPELPLLAYAAEKGTLSREEIAVTSAVFK